MTGNGRSPSSLTSLQLLMKARQRKAAPGACWKIVRNSRKKKSKRVSFGAFSPKGRNMTAQPLQKVDHSALKTNQIIIISLNLLAFIFNLPILAALVAAVMGIGSALKIPGFGFVYHYVLKPRGWMKPDILDDNPEPHRFAQLLGFLFMTAGSITLYLGAAVLGWSLV